MAYASDFLNHFSQIVMMIELLDTLPEIAEDIGRWRPKRYDEHVERRCRQAIVASGPFLHPIICRAFEAMVAGLNAQGVTAAELCRGASSPMAASERAACREVAVSMSGLLERAMSLLEPDADTCGALAQERADRALAPERGGRAR